MGRCRGDRLQTAQFESGRIAGGVPISRGALYQILRNRLYRGEIAHRGEVYPVNHEPIVEPQLWDAVQARLAEQAARPRGAGLSRKAASGGRASAPRALLADLVFDASGNRLTSHFAVKRGRRYHYYVSAGLVRGQRLPNGVRVPAADLEQLVVSALQRHLTNPVWVGTTLSQAGDASWTQRLIVVAKVLGERIGTLGSRETSGEMTNANLLRDIIRRISVGERDVSIVVQRSSLAQWLGSIDPTLLTTKPTSAIPHDEPPYDRKDESREAKPDEDVVTITVPTRGLRCGKQVKLVVGDVETHHTKIDQPLLKLISDAHRWFEALRTGRCQTIASIAASEGRQVSNVSRSISLAFLAPDIVEMIVKGRQPLTLTPERLKACRPLPHDWAEQRQLLLADR